MAREGLDDVVQAAGDVMSREGVEVGRSIGGEVLTVRGRIFAFPQDGGVVVKVPADRKAALVESGRGQPVTMGQRTMREWVLVPAEAGQAAWRELLVEACDYVGRSG